MPRIQANLLLLLAGAIWGMGFVAQFAAMSNIGPFLFIGLRFVMATLAILPFAMREARRGGRALARPQWHAFMIVGLLLFGGMLAQQVGLMSTTVTRSGFLTGLYVVIVPFVGIVLFRQWPHPAVWPAALAALAGIWLLSGGWSGRLSPGDWLTMLCAVFWALQVLFTGRLATATGRPVTLAVVQFAVCAGISLCAAVAFEPMSLPSVWQALPEIIYTGVFSGGLAFTLQAVGQRYTTAPQAAIFLSTEAVFAALFGAVFLGERVTLSGLLGAALIFSAILMTEIVPTLLVKGQRR